ncbi:DUF4843 domain-containing protein [Olleya sp. HaHaR_3_96]|uniref:DUF4843 domain-containing protein n=1 Tax=Olleya sp. HaHaR_3_96 TaxID=2745560 RepID=UPI001C4E9C1D|nr:DUF4843 domain-containing protein [Olleya sp. HaHaR_3_96]QXP59883.1 hypothetical protein H0I26_18560 [Olleya sp. HaHaR_3_96]
MKNIRKILTLSLVAFSFFACEENENVTYDGSLTGVGFTSATTSAIVPSEGTTVTVEAQVTNLSESARTFNVTVDMDATTAPSASNYSFGTITIPANSFEGTLDVALNDTDLVDMVSYDLVLKLDLNQGIGVVGSEITTIKFNKYLICNDIILTLNEDAYADERNWNITDSSGAIVVQCSDYGDCPTGAASGTIAAAQYVYAFTLPDGCYTFNITDVFADGQFDTNITGDYSLDCSIINHASGSGNWGASESTDFCVNP